MTDREFTIEIIDRLAKARLAEFEARAKCLRLDAEKQIALAEIEMLKQLIREAEYRERLERDSEVEVSGL